MRQFYKITLKSIVNMEWMELLRNVKVTLGMKYRILHCELKMQKYLKFYNEKYFHSTLFEEDKNVIHKVSLTK